MTSDTMYIHSVKILFMYAIDLDIIGKGVWQLHKIGCTSILGCYLGGLSTSGSIDPKEDQYLLNRPR